MKIKILFILLLLNAYLFGEGFGIVLANAITPEPIKSQYDKNIIIEIHNKLITLAKFEMEKDLDTNQLTIKIFNKHNEDNSIMQKISDTVVNIVKNYKTPSQNSDDMDIGNFKPINSNSTLGYKPVASMIILIKSMEEIYKNNDIENPILKIYRSNGEFHKNVPFRGLFAIVYDLKSDDDDRSLDIYILFSSTHIIKTQNGTSSVILQIATFKNIQNKDILQPLTIAGKTYKIIAEKIKNILDAEKAR